MLRNDGTCWVLVARVTPQELREAVGRYFDAVGMSETAGMASVAVVAGESEWSIAYSRNEAHETLDRAIACDVSERVDGSVFVLSYSDEDHGAPGAYEYRGGSPIAVHDVDYDAFLRDRQCALPTDDPFELNNLDSSRSVVVLEGARDLESIRVYLEQNHPEKSPIEFRRSRGGMPMLQWNGADSWGLLKDDLGEASIVIYCVTFDPERSRLKAEVFDGDSIRELGTPPPGAPTSAYATSIKGATTPEGVIDALGIPREALGLT